jgi:hypothetical protein
MSPTPKQHIHVHLPRGDQQRIAIAGRYYRVAMREAYPQTAVGDDLREGERGGGRVAVEVAFDEVQVGGEGAEVVVGGAVGEVAKAEDLAYLTRSEEFFELFHGTVLLACGLGIGIFEVVPLRECPAVCMS